MSSKKKSKLLKLTKETPEARKQRVASGVKFRAAVFENKKKKSLEKVLRDEE
ncbi:MAG: hypothetical protein LBS74_06830 [Oscillospiraceae bacterium]|jgi:hypothetical protein|nr:hypothetical protein [Oscillospiraceae bacterium]